MKVTADQKQAIFDAIRNILQSEGGECGEEIMCSVIAGMCLGVICRILNEEK